MTAWADRVHRGVIDDARSRQARQRRWLVGACAAAIVVVAIASALLGGGGALRGGVTSSLHASGAATVAAGATVGAVLRDCGAGNDPLHGSYSYAALSAALAQVESSRSPLRYSTCAEAIFRAINSDPR